MLKSFVLFVFIAKLQLSLKLLFTLMYVYFFEGWSFKVMDDS